MVRPSDGYISGVGDVLHALNIDDAVVDEILTSLDVASTEMPGQQSFPDLGAGVFTTLPAGTEMATHTNAAQQYLADAIAEMMEILGLYSEGVIAIRHGNAKTDDFAASDLTKIRHVVEQANAFNRQPDHGRGGHS